MCALTRIALVGLMVIASTTRCGRPRFGAGPRRGADGGAERTVDTERAAA